MLLRLSFHLYLQQVAQLLMQLMKTVADRFWSDAYITTPVSNQFKEQELNHTRSLLLSPCHNSFICCDQNVIVVVYCYLFYKTACSRVIFMQTFEEIQLGCADENNAKPSSSNRNKNFFLTKRHVLGFGFHPILKISKIFRKLDTGELLLLVQTQTYRSLSSNYSYSFASRIKVRL